MARAEQSAAPPRVVVAGLAGDSGKSLVALGLAKALAARGFGVAAFKKGPDFIDAAWLAAASGRDARNLDTFLMPKEALVASFVRGSVGAGAPFGPEQVGGHRPDHRDRGPRTGPGHRGSRWVTGTGAPPRGEPGLAAEAEKAGLVVAGGTLLS